MSLLYQSNPYTISQKEDAIKTILEQSLPDRDFYLLLVGAILLAISGIYLDSIAVLIASMIVAPLAYPILSFGLGIVVGDIKLIARSLGMLLIAFIVGMVGA